MKKASQLATLVLTGFILAVVFHYFQSAYLGLPYPYNTFLFTPLDRFADFFVLYRVNLDLNPYLAHACAQYPFTNWLFVLFSRMPEAPAFGLYTLLTIVSFASLIFFFLKEEPAPNKIILAFLSYPFLFTVDRGNVEGLLYVLLALFVLFFVQKRFWQSAILLGLAGAMKIYPLIFAPLFLIQKRYKETGILILTFLSASLLPLFFFQGGFLANLQFVLHGSNFVNPIYDLFLGPAAFVQRGVSLFTFLKILLIQFGWIDGVDMGILLKGYFVFIILFAIPYLFYAFFIEKTFWKQIALLTFGMLLFPHISADYKLIHLFLPILLFLTAPPRRDDAVYWIAFGLLLIPKAYFFLPNIQSDSGTTDISIGVVLNVLIMLFLILYIVFTGIQSRKEASVSAS